MGLDSAQSLFLLTTVLQQHRSITCNRVRPDELSDMTNIENTTRADSYKRSRTTTQLTRSELRGKWDEAKRLGTDFRRSKRHAVINRNCTLNVGRTN